MQPALAADFGKVFGQTQLNFIFGDRDQILIDVHVVFADLQVHPFMKWNLRVHIICVLHLLLVDDGMNETSAA